MRETRPFMIAVLAAGPLVTTGCTHQWEVRLVPGDEETANEALASTSETPANDAFAQGETTFIETELAFATDDPAPAPSYFPEYSAPVNFGDSAFTPQQEAKSVGLYGELVSAPVPHTGRFDGAGNLAQITTASEGANFDPALDPTGRTLAFASTQHRHTSDIYVKSISGRTMTQVTTDPADDVMPSFAPDSERIAFASNRAGDWNIHVTNTNGDPPIQLTFDGAHELHPSWSPDGETIIYCKLGEQSGRWEIWAVEADQGAAPRFLEYGLFPQWNPDPSRSKVVFQRARQRGSRMFSVWTIDIVGGEAMHPTEIVSAANAAAMHPAWSPDGSRIVFVTVVEPDGVGGERPQQSDVWVIDTDGKGRTNLTNGKFLNLYPTWGADGTVYFLSDRSGVDNIWAAATDRMIEPSMGNPLVTAEPALEETDQP